MLTPVKEKLASNIDFFGTWKKLSWPLAYFPGKLDNAELLIV